MNNHNSSVPRRGPSVDDLGRITYVPTKKTYRALDPNLHVGQQVKIITCLNNSETITESTDDGRRRKVLITRVYSLSDRRLLGHASRFILEEVRPIYEEGGYDEVIATHSKTPHAWLQGRIKRVISNSDYQSHRKILESFSRDHLYIAYDPYKTKTFKYCNDSHLPAANKVQRLQDVCPEPHDVVPEIYCYESGILAMN